jgi:hypothetical protein
MGLIIIDRGELEKLLVEEASSWMEIGGGPNMNAYEFDPKTVDKKQLEIDGFYSNYDAWIAGTRVKRLEAFIIKHLYNAVSGD